MTEKPRFIPKQDRVFASAERGARRFQFDEAVADAFDDMARRSIPGYLESLRTIVWLAEERVAPQFSKGKVYDLGASTGALEEALLQSLAQRPWQVIAVDLSEEMLARAQDRLRSSAGFDQIEWRCEDVRDTVFEGAILVVSNYCLQFIGPADREQVLARIFKSLAPGAYFVLSEKTLGSPDEEPLFLDRYDAFKRDQGYAEQEILNKRRALTGVLVPWSVQQNEQALRDAGFEPPALISKQWNFCTWIARKPL